MLITSQALRPLSCEDALDIKLFAVQAILAKFWTNYARNLETALEESSDVIFTIWWAGDPRLEVLIETGPETNLQILQEITNFVESRTKNILRLFDQAPEF